MKPSDESPTRSFYNCISKLYDALAHTNEHVAREKGLDLLAVQSSEDVLEIGYGTGHTLVRLAESVRATDSVTGLDISQGMHDVAQRRIEQAGVADRVTLQVGVAPPLPYADGSFDAVCMSFTLELFPEVVIPAVLGEIRRVLRPNGRLGVVAMTVVDEGNKESVLEQTYKWMHQHFPHIVDCQPIPAEAMLEEAGFDVRARHVMDIWTMPVTELVGVRNGAGQAG